MSGALILITNQSVVFTLLISTINLASHLQAGFSAAPTRAISSIKNMNIPQQIKDIKLPDLPQAIKDLKM